MQPVALFHRQARATPDAIAAEHDTARITYAALHARAAAVAAGLQALDPEPGSRVGICCYNHIDHLVAWLGVLAAGKVWVPLYPPNGAAEIARAIDFTAMSLVVADAEAVPLVEGAGARVLVVGDGAGASTLAGLEAAHAGDAPRFHPLPLDATQAIKFTGGSTGRPKGVMQPYRAWNANIVTQIRAWGLGAGDRYLAAAPITHGTSTYILPTLATGGTLVLLDRPRPAGVLHALAEKAIATTFVPPTLVYMMMLEPDIETLRFPALRNLVYGSAPMRPEAIERAQRLFGGTLASTYGQTEAPQIATMIGPADLMIPERQASVGRETWLTQVGIIDPSGRLLPDGEIGEIVIRGDLVMTGYWRQPDKTAETLRDGWLHTGDLGLRDADGFVFIKGRAKDMIITGGFNVYPADVEPVLGAHPAVADCAVFGVPDDKWGEAVQAAVELRPGQAAEPAEIMAFVRARLGPVRTPKTITICKALPRNAYGKLQKQALVEAFLAAAGKGTT